jgi:hypothetical protein
MTRLQALAAAKVTNALGVVEVLAFGLDASDGEASRANRGGAPPDTCRAYRARSARPNTRGASPAPG